MPKTKSKSKLSHKKRLHKTRKHKTKRGGDPLLPVRQGANGQDNDDNNLFDEDVNVNNLIRPVQPPRQRLGAVANANNHPGVRIPPNHPGFQRQHANVANDPQQHDDWRFRPPVRVAEINDNFIGFPRDLPEVNNQNPDHESLLARINSLNNHKIYANFYVDNLRRLLNDDGPRRIEVDIDHLNQVIINIDNMNVEIERLTEILHGLLPEIQALAI